MTVGEGLASICLVNVGDEDVKIFQNTRVVASFSYVGTSDILDKSIDITQIVDGSNISQGLQGLVIKVSVNYRLK